VGRRLWLLFLLPGLLVPVVSVMRPALGPYWLQINVDPTYAYLTNGLLLATGRAAAHTDNPGTPVQLLGAVTIRVAHLLTGRGELEEDVLARPERYLAAMRLVLVMVFVATVAVCGVLALRVTGSLAVALLLQATPFLTVRPITDLTKVKPEPLLMSIVVLMAALVAVCLLAPARLSGWRRVIAFGLLCGAGMATKVTMLPLLIVPFAVLRSWLQRAGYLTVTVATFFAITVPATVSIRKFFRFITRYATHTEAYGRGDEAILPPDLLSHRLPSLITKLAVEEWVFLGPLLASFAVVIAVPMLRRLADLDPRQQTAWRVLALLVVAGAGSLLLVAKNPGVPERYLVPTFAIAGLMPVAMSVLAGPGCLGLQRAVRRSAGVALVAAAGIHFVIGIRSDMRYLRRSRDASLSRQAGAEAAAAGVPCTLVQTTRSSTRERALHFGNQIAGRRFGATLDRLYPGVIIIASPNPGFRTFTERLTVQEAFARGDLCAVGPERGMSWPPGVTVRPVEGTEGLVLRLEGAPADEPEGTS